MNLFKSNFPDKAETFFKILVAFAAEADHYIGSERAVVKAGTQAFAKRTVFVRCVMAVHAPERVVAAALQRYMKLRTKFFAF